MASFAPDTNRDFGNAYTGWFYGDGRRQGTPAPRESDFGPRGTPPQQQQSPSAAPSKAPDMSAYAQPSGGYNAYNVPRTPPRGARTNDLSGNVPSNQVWGQAYNQVAGQYGVPGATSFTMPGSFTSQGYNPSTGQYGPMTGGQSFNGNMAYNAIDSRPSPVTASATGLGGGAMPFQDSLMQREAFVGNLSQRLGQYSGGQQTGPVTFDPSQLMQQANDQLANGTFYNPFSQNPDFQRAMGNSNQYMQGTFQNPFGQQANVPTPSFGQQSYNPNLSEADRIFRENYGNNPANWVRYDPATGMATHGIPAGGASPGGSGTGQPSTPNVGLLADGMLDSPPAPAPSQPSRPRPSSSPPADERPLTATPSRRFDPTVFPAGAWVWENPEEGRRFERQAGVSPSGAASPPPSEITFTPEQQADIQATMQAYNQRQADRAKAVAGQARPVQPPSQGTPYNPQAEVQGLPDVPDAQPSYGEDPIAARKKAAKAKAQEDADLKSLRDRWLSGATTGQSYKEKLGGKNFKDYTPDEMADRYTGELWKRLNDGRLSQADYDKAVAGMDTDLNQSKARQAKIQQINGEIAKWEQATYGTFKGNGPPPEWRSHIQALQRLRTKAEAGDPAALAWNPKMKAPAANASPNVPLNRRGNEARFGSMRQNGDNRR